MKYHTLAEASSATKAFSVRTRSNVERSVEIEFTKFKLTEPSNYSSYLCSGQMWYMA